MPEAYNSEIRKRVLTAVEMGMSYGEAATHFQVSPRWVGTVVREYRKTGSLTPRTQHHGPPPTLGSREQEWITDWLTHDPRLTQLRVTSLLKAHNVRVSIFTVARTLRRMGWVRVDRRWRNEAAEMSMRSECEPYARSAG